MVEYTWQRIVRTQAPLLVVTTIIALAAGVVLLGAEDRLLANAWVLALFPVINAIGGNLGSVLGSRLTSALHLGSFSTVRSRELGTNLAATLLISGSMFGALTLVVWAITPRLGLGGEGVGLATTAALVLGCGAFITLGAIVLSLVTAFVSFRRGLDPDDIVIPVVSTLADLIGVAALIGLSEVLL